MIALPEDATVNFFFGAYWRAPLVLVVLAAFTAGLVVGALGMLPGWWKHRAAAAQVPPPEPAQEPVAPVVTAPPTTTQELTVARNHGL